jgi:hypothetical protein
MENMVHACRGIRKGDEMTYMASISVVVIQVQDSVSHGVSSHFIPPLNSPSLVHPLVGANQGIPF